MKETSLRHLALPMIFLVVFNILPGVYLRPFWSLCFCGVLLGYRIWLEWREDKMPPRLVMLIGQLLAALMIWQHYSSFMGDEAAGTFLSLLACLKLFELRAKRDYFIAVVLCFLVLMSFLLLDQSLLLTLFLLADITFLISFLFTLEDDRRSWRGWRSAIAPGIQIALKALPLVVLIFLLFPRFSTGFGSGTNTIGKTGVSDSLRPGSVGSLIKSDELVFRATFLDGNIPARQNLYWRGAVLDQSHGMNWDRSQAIVSPQLSLPGRTGDIEIYLEPGNEKFLFSLDTTRMLSFPNDLNNNRVNLRTGQIFELDSPLQNRERYYLHNDANRVRETDSPKAYLATEGAPSNALKRLLKKVQRPTTRATVQEVLSEFHNGGFTYSMEPLPARNLDQFLFGTKNGFCEHYAGAMATMLRHLGIPSRVIVGFQGGTPSLLDSFFTVRANDAHAWVEYYDDGVKIWKRADPTAEVEPQRIVVGSASYRTEQGSWLPGGWQFLARARSLIDEVDARWSSFLIRFDLRRQKEILAGLGMEGVLFRALPVFLILAIALILAFLYFFEAQRPETVSEQEALYLKLLRRLKRWKVERRPSEGPRELLERLEREHPHLAIAVEPILTELTVIRFGGKPLERHNRDQLRLRMRALKKLSIKAASR